MSETVRQKAEEHARRLGGWPLFFAEALGIDPDMDVESLFRERELVRELVAMFEEGTTHEDVYYAVERFHLPAGSSGAGTPP